MGVLAPLRKLQTSLNRTTKQNETKRNKKATQNQSQISSVLQASKYHESSRDDAREWERSCWCVRPGRKQARPETEPKRLNVQLYLSLHHLRGTASSKPCSPNGDSITARSGTKRQYEVLFFLWGCRHCHVTDDFRPRDAPLHDVLTLFDIQHHIKETLIVSSQLNVRLALSSRNVVRVRSDQGLLDHRQ